jgi:hypothetical protein
MTTTNENRDPQGDRGTVESIRPWGDIHMVVRNQNCSVDLTGGEHVMRFLLLVAFLTGLVNTHWTVASEVTSPMSEKLNRAEWIWCEGEAVPENFYLYCRRTFEVNGEADRASLHITAGSRYQLFVNGQFVGRGPARSLQEWQQYDTYDILPHLRPGENCIAAIVHHFGVETHNTTLGRGGFFAQGEVVAGGATTRLDTGDSWRLLPASAHVEMRCPSGLLRHHVSGALRRAQGAGGLEGSRLQRFRLAFTRVS